MSRCALSSVEPARDAITRLFRSEYGRWVAALTRRFGAGQLDLIESSLQEALLRCLERWTGEEPPDYLGSWILRVAHNLAIDELRRQRRQADAAERLESDSGVIALGRGAADWSEADAGEFEAGDAASPLDDELQLMLLCCHPSLGRAAQVALTLKVGCGFSALQIAQAFLSSEETIAQRVVRAKQRLRQVDAHFELPPSPELSARLPVLLEVLYLVFNEGFSPSDGEAAIKQELCAEALRLSRTLGEAAWAATPATHALHALLCLHAARAPARLADDGSLLLLAEQDRSRWDGKLIAEGFASLTRAADGCELTRFHLEAGIAACYAAATSHHATDWAQLVFLYDELRRLTPSPIVEVNRAVAVAMHVGAQAGLDELDAIPERSLIESYPYALAAYAELHAALGELDQARAYLDRALDQQPSQAQRLLLQRKRNALSR